MITKTSTALVSETNNMSTLIGTGGAGSIVLRNSTPTDLCSITCGATAFGTPNSTTGIAILQGLPRFSTASASGTCAGFVVRSGAGTALFEGTVNGNYTFTANSTTDVFTAVGHPFANDDIVRVTVAAGATLPAGLAVETDYYIIDNATDVFSLSATLGGAAIDITTNGTGVFKVAKTDAALVFDGGSPNPLEIISGQLIQITSFVYNPQP